MQGLHDPRFQRLPPVDNYQRCQYHNDRKLLLHVHQFRRRQIFPEGKILSH